MGGPDYGPLNEQSIRAFLAGVPACNALLTGTPDSWTVREIGDGNLNLVFVVAGGTGSLIVKQALPYVRLVGDSWPLPLDRAYFEHEALVAQTRHVPGLVPKIHHFDTAKAAIVMEYLSPHIILRKGLINGTRYPLVAEHLSTFMAEMLFRTSDLATPAAEKKAAQSVFCQNTALCKISEDLIFTDPYRVAPLNRWTTPQLDDAAAAFRSDSALKVAVQALKWAFLSRGEALLHGDLHTGSVMVTAADTRVIDPEFAFYGPIGFDIGAILANFLLAFLAQPGQATEGDDREAYRPWLLDTVEALWNGFERKFFSLWRSHAEGDAFTAELFADEAGAAALEAHRHQVMRRIFADSMGFAGAKMARRILGLAHVEDLECIENTNMRAHCELNALFLARTLILHRENIPNIANLRQLAVQAATGNRTGWMA